MSWMLRCDGFALNDRTSNRWLRSLRLAAPPANGSQASGLKRRVRHRRRRRRRDVVILSRITGFHFSCLKIVGRINEACSKPSFSATLVLKTIDARTYRIASLELEDERHIDHAAFPNQPTAPD